jgi:HEPN domain-containing protein
MNKENELLSRGFIQAANNDLEIIHTLYTKYIHNILIFYHLQQALEKLLKASYIEIGPSNQNYNQIKKLGHNAGDISFKLIFEICSLYEKHFEENKQFYGEDEISVLIKQMNFYKDSVQKELETTQKEYINNVKNYDTFVNRIYSEFVENKSNIKESRQKSILIATVGLFLSKCLYKMDMISRYPEEDFQFQNLSLLKNNLNSIDKIMSIFEFFIKEISPNDDFANL